MTPRDDDDAVGRFASPPCLMHELDPVYGGLSELADPRRQTDVQRWRKAERARLIAARLAMPPKVRRRHDAAIREALEAAIGDAEGRVIAVYWPVRGEPDLRPLVEHVVARGGRCALPVVVEHRGPLRFRAWSPGERLVRGVAEIPVPEPTALLVAPDVVVAPVVGFDRAGYRLGYGGGFYDRTLAATAARPNVFGVGYALAAIATIYPQWHDVPVDAVVTEAGPTTPG